MTFAMTHFANTRPLPVSTLAFVLAFGLCSAAHAQDAGIAQQQTNYTQTDHEIVSRTIGIGLLGSGDVPIDPAGGSVSRDHHEDQKIYQAV